MNEPKKRLLKSLYVYINSSLEEERVEVSEYIKRNCMDIVQTLQLNAGDSELIKYICTDNACSFYINQLIPTLKKLCDGYNNRILLSEKDGSYFLSLNEYARNFDNKLVQHYCNILQKICEEEKISATNRGVIFENFCCKWFSMFFKEVRTTPKIKDKGIDLQGIVENESTRLSFFRGYTLFFYAQIKFFAKPVDIPVVRSFLGDTMLLTFENGPISIYAPSLLCIVGHSGFTREAKRFGESKGILLLDSMDLLRVAAGMDDFESLECIKYLQEISDEQLHDICS